MGVTGLNKQVSDLSFLFNLLKQKMLGKLKKNGQKPFFSEESPWIPYPVQAPP